MIIEVRAPGLRLSLARALFFAGWVRRAFNRAAHGVTRVVFRIWPAQAAPQHSAQFHCEVEVHFPDGSVSRVHEVNWRLGLLMRRATVRGLQAALPLLAGTPKHPAPFTGKGLG